nr:unnamed protein product [Digitaria exilis]
MPGDGDAVSSRGAQASRGRRKRQTPALPLDVLAEIAARSVDPTTLVRCAATCRDMRRRAADESFRRRRLRLRHTGGRFVLPLLRGHLTGPTHGLGISLSDGERDKQYLIDTTAAAMATKLTRLVFPPTPQGSPHETFEPLDSRGGLILLAVRDNSNHHYYQERRHLRVCDPVTRHSHTFPLGQPPPLNGSSFVFLVLEAKLTLSPYDRSARCLRIRIFTSEHGGVWGPRTRIPTPSLDGGLYSDYELPLAKHSKPLVVGDVVHWLCLTQNGSYVLMLHVGATPSPRARVTTLPASFPRGSSARRRRASAHVAAKRTRVDRRVGARRDRQHDVERERRRLPLMPPPPQRACRLRRRPGGGVAGVRHGNWINHELSHYFR